MEKEIVSLLKKNQMTVTTAESCTGGLIASRIVNVSGASEVFMEGYITYANASKEKILGVKHETIEEYGVVSSETAKEMAEGAKRVAEADVAISVTGIAGPSGGTKEKPVGLVYIGCASELKIDVRRFVFEGNRDQVREQAVAQALSFLRDTLLEIEEA